MQFKNEMMKIYAIILICLFSCANSIDEKLQINAINYSFLHYRVGEKLYLDEQNAKLILEEYNAELSRRKLLDSCINLAKANVNLPYWKHDFEQKQNNESEGHVSIEFGNFFDDSEKYLVIKSYNLYLGSIYILHYFEGRFDIRIELEKPGMPMIRDTIFDVNGDSAKDYLIHFYPMSGCCKRDVYFVYINKGYNFSEYFKFMNPTFFPKEKLVRGVGYGHPGETELYKMKWTKYELDTIEFIATNEEVANRMTYWRYTTDFDNFDTTKMELLQEVPKEYIGIDGLNWFNGEI